MVYLDKFLDSFFYSFPNEPKPPIAVRPVPEDGQEGFVKEYKGVEVQFAVAGFKEEDLMVWFEDRSLFVKGSNIDRDDIAQRFQCAFERQILIKEDLDVDKAEISLKNGVLAIFLPKKSRKKARKFLLGKKD